VKKNPGLHPLKKPASMTARPAQLLTVLLCLSFTSLAQNIGQKEWYHADTSIEGRSNLQDLRKQIEGWKMYYSSAKNDAMLARCYYYLQQIDDLTTEDSLFFKNSLYIDSIIGSDESSAMLKSIMYVLKAKRLRSFAHNANFIRNRPVNSYDADINYNNMGIGEIDSLVKIQFEKALSINISAADIKELYWISSDTSVFLFTPDWQDIIYAERVEAFLNYAQGRRDENVARLLALSQDDFIQLPYIEENEPGLNRLFDFFKQWIKRHSDNPSVYYYIETMARLKIFNSPWDDTTQEKLYERYLQNLTASRWYLVKAYGIYQLTEFWNTQAQKYNPIEYASDDLDMTEPFRTEYKMHFVKALQLYEANQELLRQFPALNRALLDIKAAMKNRDLFLYTYNMQSPGLPILAFFRCRNIEKLHIKIVKGEAVLNDETDEPQNLSALKGMPAAQAFVKDLPTTGDYQWHNSFLKIDPLQPGKYVILFSDSAITEQNRNVGHLPITITPITVINTDQRVFVLDRQTGLPLAGAAVISGEERTKYLKPVDTAWYTTAPKIVNEAGYVTVDLDSTDMVRAAYKGDTLQTAISEYESQLEDEIYDEEYYDNLKEFFLEHASMNVFTDRAIYRPGQTVHYKAIIFTNHPKTAERIIWSGKKIKSPYFKKIFRRGSPKLKIYIKDPFQRKVDSVTLIPDEFGTISGSYVIPKNAPTGNWEFASKDRLTDYGNSFKVEEYKRPTFEVLIERPQRELYLGDSLTLKVIVQSFAGARLSNTRVKFSIEASGYLPGQNEFRHRTLVEGIAYTDSKGELLVPLNDTAIRHMYFPPDKASIMRYDIRAQAIDATGESDEGYALISQSTRPVYIDAEIPAIMDRYALPPLEIVTTSELAGKVKKTLQVRIFKEASRTVYSEEQAWPSVDLALYPRSEFERWFPGMRPLPKQDTSKILVYETVTTTGGEKFVLPANVLPAGNYNMQLICRENEKVTGERDFDFSIFDKQANALPSPTKDFDHISGEKVQKGEKITWITGNTESDIYSIYHATWYARDKNSVTQKSQYVQRLDKRGINQWEFIIPQDATGKMLLTHLYIIDNRLYEQEHEVFVEDKQTDPEIIVEQYRSRLRPGGKETFTVSVKTKDEHTLAQLMTTLYDATLDQLAVHYWQTPRFPDIRLYNNWTSEIAEKIYRDIYFYEGGDYNGDLGSLMWIKPMHAGYLKAGRTQYLIEGTMIRSKFAPSFSYSFNKSLSLNEVAVMGYGTVKKNSSGPSSPELPPLPSPLTRKNFSETAFFYPRIYAGKDGFYTISFTLPESVTTWKWKMFAHTQDAKFAYAERTLVSQLPLMVQPDMPRFLYQGDKIVLKSRITNLDSVDMNGTLQCTIEDVVTGEDLTSRLTATNKKGFSVSKSSNNTGAFEINIPADLLHPIRIKISALAGSISDGEEHIIPIQAKKILVSRHVALNDQEKSVSTPGLPADASAYGVGIYIDPQPKAAMVNALPWLVNYPHACAEQTFNKLFAHALAVKLMRTDISLQSSMPERKKKLAAYQQAMTDGLPEASMPWLQLNHKHAIQQQQLVKVLDTLAAKNMIAKHVQELYQLLNEDGGISWFKGGVSNDYISSYMLAGLGKLQIMLNDVYDDIKNDYPSIVSGLVRYCDTRFVNRQMEQSEWEFLQYLYGRSYFTKSYPLPAAVTHRIDSLLTMHWQHASRISIGKQAMLIIVTTRMLPAENDLHKKALQQLESLRQLAIRDNVNGIRWKDVADADDLDICSEEWVVKIAEAFEENKNDQQTIPGIVQWLLRAKQDHNWSTTKATADVLSLLYRQPPTLAGHAQQYEARIDNKTYTVSNDLLKGELFRFIELPGKSFPAEIPVTANGGGGINYYYFTESPDAGSASAGVKIGRTLSRYNSSSSKWEVISPSTVLSTGDKIKATLHITTPRMLQYVYIDEKRAAACEPADATSGYEYGDRFNYYKSVRDIGFQFFAEKIPSGASAISYEMVVAKTGSFAWGPAVLECMYRPEIKAYSNSLSLEIKE
jgi:hypothetical protein